MASLDDLKKDDKAKLTSSELTEAFYKGTAVAAAFSFKVFRPLVAGIISPDDREKAFIGIYYRMACWIDSLTKLGPEAVHFQAAGAAARGLFELLLDLKLLTADTTTESVEKFHAFTDSERFRRARQFVKWKDRHPGAKNFSDRAERERVAKAGEAALVEAIVKKYWGINNKGELIWPDHWSGFNASDRADKAGEIYAEIYQYLYSKTSWMIHAGFVGQGGLKKETFDAYMGLFHSRAQEFFLEGLELTAKALKLDVVMTDLKKNLGDLGLVAGAAIVEGLSKQLDRDRDGEAGESVQPIAAAAAPAPRPKVSMARPAPPPSVS